MASITVDPLRHEDLAGLKDPDKLLAAFNRLQSEAGLLNGGAKAGLTAANFRRVALEGRELVVPDEWLPLTPINGFADAGAAGSEFAVRKAPDGTVHMREMVARGAGAPADGTVIAELPAGFAPEGPVFLVGTSTGEVLSTVRVQPTGSSTGVVEFRTGDPTSFQVLHGSWVAVDKSMPPWSTPLTVSLPLSTNVGVREVWVTARRANVSDVGLPVPAVCYSPTVQRVQGQEQLVLSLPRIDGLRPGTRYTVTLWAFLE